MLGDENVPVNFGSPLRNTSATAPCNLLDKDDF